jgi:hypothetical protein
MRSSLGDFKDRKTRADDLIRQASNLLESIVSDIEKRFAAMDKQIASLRASRGRRGADNAIITKQIHDLEVSMQKLDQEQLDWRNGKR